MATEADLVRSIDAEALAEWVPAQRWFASKAREVTIGLVEVLVLEERPPLGLALVEARFAAGTRDLYQLLVGPGDLEALTTPESAQALARLLTRESRVQGEHGVIAFHWTGAPLAAESVRLLGAEQSNTSIVIDESAVLKVFRRLEAGDNPELEMVRFLTSRGFENVPALRGWYALEGELLDATLGVAQELVHGGRDGWELVLEMLAVDPGRALEDLAELGGVIGRMHTVLGSDITDPDFAPDDPGEEGLALLTATIDEEIERVFLDLPDGDEAVEPIAGRGEEVRDRLQHMSHVVVGGKLIRHHGDLHLGQTLRTPDRWVILDFEGEPARPLIDRRRKRSPLRDVAGMLRSFAYASSASRILHGAPVPDDWESTARERFLDGYFTEVDAGLLPASEAGIRQLLAIYELEKAVYELRYELNNRPDWVPIPVSGIARLLQEPLT
jgi:trehalose synthase-fused probable maltokinase